MLYIQYPRCSTCKKGLDFLTENNIDVKTRDIVLDNPSADEIKTWHEKSGLDIKKFFNTSGLKYKELCLKDKLPTMSTDDKYQLLATDGMLVKRPILIFQDKILIGRDIYKVID